MKTYTITCEGCGKKLTAQGRSVDEIVKALDKSGWEDLPDRMGRCPKCLQAAENSELQRC